MMCDGWKAIGGGVSLASVGELLLQLFLGLAEFFSGLFPERFREAARTGPMWRRALAAIGIALGSLIIGLTVAAIVFAAGAVLFGVVAGRVRIF